MHILLVDDEAAVVQSVRLFLQDLGHEVTTANNGHEALKRFRAGAFHVVLTDLKMPGMDGFALLAALQQQGGRELDIIVFTGHGDEAVAIQALRAGAFDYLKKPLNIEELAIALERAEEHLNLQAENYTLTTRFDAALEEWTAPLRNHLQRLEQTLSTELGIDKARMFSAATRRVFEEAQRFHKKRDVPVLIEGESGTGKELVARYLHAGDASPPGPFIAINCTAMPAELFQSELFGYEGGAFTGAQIRGSSGKIALAQGGTLFLDEISEIPLDLQVRLLRVLETREYYRVGGLKKLTTDARIICATNRILADEVEQGRFRRDLYHRINVGHIVIPPLRERREEIVPLAEAFLTEFNQKHGTRFRDFSPEVRQYLSTQPWPGNIRELRNTIERAVILSDSDRLTTLALAGPRHEASAAPISDDWELPLAGFDIEQHELGIVRRALAKHGGNKTQTARYLGLSLKALQSRLRKL